MSKRTIELLIALLKKYEVSEKVIKGITDKYEGKQLEKSLTDMEYKYSTIWFESDEPEAEENFSPELLQKTIDSIEAI